MFAKSNEKAIRKLSLKIGDIAFNWSLIIDKLMIFETIMAMNSIHA